MSETADRVVLEPSWKTALLPEFEKPYMRQLRDFLLAEKRARKVVYPKGSEIFAALNLTPLPKVRVVVIGQDPYHGPNQAHGLCFSIRPGVPRPPSLENIFQEVSDDVAGGEIPPRHGCLIPWAQQGVLLLNSVLTVERGRAGSHQGRGWETFTDRVVELIKDESESVVFMLWGSYAHRKGALVDTRRHLVLTAPHPSPLSANRGFFGCRHFSSANRYLKARGFDPIDWFAVD